jgi:3D (Asp-Asp-Asp) domain-containing protein
MNNKRIPQTIGIFFILITTSVYSKESASGQSKNNSTTIDNKNKVEMLARGTSYNASDLDSATGKTSSLIPISTVKKLGLQVVAVDPSKIPYGSIIIGKNKSGEKIVGVAVDTGSAVKSRKAAKNYALAKGYDKESPEYNALVFDFHSKSGDITKAWDNFTVVFYTGPEFKFDLKNSEKIQYLKYVQQAYLL